MRIVYFDIDTLRADHLGCYGYGRETSPCIDAIAAEGIRFENTYASDTPCLPSRTALSTGRFGTRNGVVGHGGSAAEPFREGVGRGFRSAAAAESWVSVMQRGGMWSASISTFPERHSAFHFLAGYNEWHNMGSGGLETADQVSAVATDWLRRNAHREDWFLHVHFWDPHTPYRTPMPYGEPFGGLGYPEWLTEDVRAGHWGLPGPHSAQEMSGFEPRNVWSGYPRQPDVASDMTQVRRMFDGYDTGIRFADQHVGLIVETLRALGVYDTVAVMVSADHGETLGELGIYCDHQTADQHVSRVPMVLRWPAMGPGETGVDGALHYQIDVAATVLELLHLKVPESWDGTSFLDTFGSSAPRGRESLVLTHGAWTAQRSVRVDQWIYIHTRHDGFHGFPEHMLFDVVADPHEQRNRAGSEPWVVDRAGALLEQWIADITSAQGGVDPLDTVMAEGGPWHARHRPDGYLARLRETGRGGWAEHLESIPPD
jgi:choline-sulfatase